MRNVSNECEISQDCTEENAFGVTVHKLCYEEMLREDAVFFCDCSSWFGYTGENCDQPSGQTITFAIFSVAVMIPACIGLLMTCYMTKKFLKSQEITTNENKKHNLFIRSCLIVMAYSFAMTIVKTADDLAALVDPTKTTLVDSLNFFGTKRSGFVNGPAGNYVSLSSGTALYGAGILTILILFSWLNLIQRVEIIVDPDTIRHIKRFQRIIIVVNAFLTLLFIIFLATFYRAAANIIGGMLALEMIVLLIYANRKFIQVLRPFEDSYDIGISKVITVVQRFSSVYLVILLFYAVMLVVHGAYGIPLSRKVPPGEFNFGAFGYANFFVILEIMLFYTMSYLNYLLNNICGVSQNQIKAGDITDMPPKKSLSKI